MHLHKKKAMMGAAALLFIFLTACGENVEEEVYTHLEEAVTLEKDFENQQEPLMEIEEKEQQLYEELLQLGQDDWEKITATADEAIGYANERQEILETEKASIEEAYEEFKLGEEKMEDLEEGIEEAEVVREVMNKRYEAYQSLYISYAEAIELDIALYEAFKDKELSREEAESHIKEVNEKYKEVMEHRDDFNEYTHQYNEAKQKLYKAAGFKIEKEESNKQQEKDQEVE